MPTKKKVKYKIVQVPIDSEIGDEPGYHIMIDWWLTHYRGLEHFHVNPEVMFTITSILERCFENLKEPNAPPKAR